MHAYLHTAALLAVAACFSRCLRALVHRSSLTTAFMRSSTAVITAEHLAKALLCVRTSRSSERCNLLHVTLHKHS
jgi:hypothetical protein